ncbi:MAG: SdrD B-like domain-containing protein, partial [Actinomycetota bacterium]|nr:SdrD B-like domain-containing protein [Actinomycetota bacterium]
MDPDQGSDAGEGSVRTGELTVEPGGAPTGESGEPLVDDVGDASSWATVDFGLTGLAIGDRVFADLDGDGIDETEPPLVGVPLRLLDADDAVIATTSTDGDGRYLFQGLVPGSYRVEVPAAAFSRGGALEGWRSSPGAADPGTDGDDDGIDPSGSSATVRTAAVTLAYGDAPTGEAVGTGTLAAAWPDAAVDATVDLGFRALAVGNRVFLDAAPANGVLDPGESGIGGVRVELWPEAD